MSDIVHVKGIVLSSMNIGDNDNRIVILTNELGKISAIARGSRRQGNHLLGLVRPFLMANFELYPRRDGYLLSNGSSIDYFEELTGDIDKLYYGFYFLEVADYYGREGIKATDTLNLLYYTFRALIQGKQSKELIKLIYEFKSFVNSGEYPNISGCGCCNRNEDTTNYGFSLWNQGIVCEDCKKKNTKYADAFEISHDLIYTLRYIAGVQSDKLYKFTVSDSVYKEFENLMNGLRRVNFDRKFKSLDVLEGMKDLTMEVSGHA